MAEVSNDHKKMMTSHDERAAFAIRLLAFGASEVKYVGGLRDQMTEDFLAFVRGAKGGASNQNDVRIMTMSLQKNDLASQVDQHILSVLEFASELLSESSVNEDQTIIERVREVASTWTLGDFRERFSREFNIELGTAHIGSVVTTSKEDVELF